MSKTVEMISARSSYGGQPDEDKKPGPVTPPRKVANVKHEDVGVCLANGFGFKVKPSKEVFEELKKLGQVESPADVKIYVAPESATN